MTKHEAALDINENIAFERRCWRFQDAGAAAMGLFLAAALAGLFGAGALSDARLETADGGAVVEYQRFVRSRAPAELRFRPKPGQERDGFLTILIDAAYMSAFDIEKITPRPESEIAGSDGVRYRFAFAPGGEPATLSFEFRARGFGRSRGGIGVDGRPAAELRQVIYP